jgi:hypothetical protein
VKGLTQLLTSLGINAVPAVGWFFEGWSSGTTLATYWFENVMMSLFIAAKILLHRRAVPCRGHFKYEAKEGAKQGPPGSYLKSFLPISLIFSAAHGFFLFAIIGLLTVNGKADLVAIDWRSLATGCVLVLVFLIIDFLIELPGLKNKTFFWIEQKANANFSRVCVVHMVLIFGMFGVALTGSNQAFFAVFVVLKTLCDLSSVIPQWDPKEPPLWLCKIMDKAPRDPKYKNMTFAEFWRQDKDGEIARRLANEKPWSAAR